MRKLDLLLGGIVCAWPMLCWGLSSDSSQPYSIQSDNLIYDRTHHVITYEGNVNITQGSSELLGDKVVVLQDEKSHVQEIITTGNLAHYSTLPDHDKPKIMVQAERIDYYPDKKTVLLTGQVEVKQGGDTISGSHIWYDMQNGVMHSLPSTDHLRTTIQLEPEKVKK